MSFNFSNLCSSQNITVKQWMHKWIGSSSGRGYHRQEALNTTNKVLKYQCKCTCQGLRSIAVDVLTWLFCSVKLLLVETTVILSFGHCSPSRVFWSQGYGNTNKFFCHMFPPFVYCYRVCILLKYIPYSHRQGLCPWLALPMAAV